MKSNFQDLQAKQAENKRTFFGEDILNDPAYSMEMFARGGRAAADMRRLEQAGVITSPFIEIGAGNTPRSLALVNHLNLQGVATDISLNSLRNAPYLGQSLAYNQMPLRICCDAHHLPFMDHTFPFAFTYRSLHHFSDPAPVVDEVYRVLAPGGTFYFNEEPFDGPLRRWLRGQRVLCDPPTRMQRIGYRIGISKLFWDDGDYERRIGITEARFDLGEWRAALAPFEDLVVEVNSRLHLASDLYTPKWAVLASSLAGGNIAGYCTKSGKSFELQAMKNIADFLGRLQCLDCRCAPLSYREGGSIICPGCGRNYPWVDGILRMLPKDLESQLFPDPSG